MRQFTVLYRGNSKYTVTVQGEECSVEDAIVHRLKDAMELKARCDTVESALDILMKSKAFGG